MNKFLTLLLVLLLAVCLVACVSSTTSDPTAGGDSSQTDTTGEEDNNDSDSDTNTEEAAIEEQILVDQNGIVIKATALDNSWLGPELKLYIENNSSQAITVQVRNTSVNGFMIEPTFSCDVAAGKKATDALSFAASDLTAHNIESIADIEVYFHIFNAESWDTIFDSEKIVLNTSASDTYTQTYDSSGTVLLDSNGIKIVYKGLSDNLFGPVAKLYIENNSDQGVTIQARDTSVNGFMIEPTFSCDVMPGKKALDGLTFFEDDLIANGIDTIIDIELYFHIFDADSWDTIADSDIVKIDTP